MAQEVTTSYRNSTVRLWDSVDVSLLEADLIGAGIANVSDDGTDCLVEAQSVPDATVNVKIGRVYITGVDDSQEDSHTERLYVRSARTITVPSNATGDVRVDAIIARIDVDVEPDAQADNIGTIELITGTGTVALLDSAIQSTIGSDAFYRLADISTPNSFTTITSSEIQDTRNPSLVNVENLMSVITGDLDYVSSTGSANAFAATLPFTIHEYSDGLTLSFKANHTITGASTLDLNGLGAKTIKKWFNVDTVANDIKSGAIIKVRYDGTNFLMLSQPSQDPASLIVGVPSGVLFPYGGSSAPSGYLLCDGAAVSRSTYADLYTAIGDAFRGEGQLATRTDNDTGIITMVGGNRGITDSETVDVYWSTGSRTGMTITLVAGADISIDGGAGDNLPSQFAPLTIVVASNKFLVPDTRGRNTLGKDDMGGTSADRVTNTDADTIGGFEGEEEIDLSHTHTITKETNQLPAGSGDIVRTTITGSSLGANQNIMNPYLTVNHIVKT